MGSGSSKKMEISPYLITTFDDAHEGGINCMAVNKDHTLIATGGEDFAAKVWFVGKANTERLKAVCSGHKGYITALKMYDEFLVTASEDKTLRKWDIDNDGEFILEYAGHKSIINDFLLTEDYLLSSSYDKTVRWWQFVTGECLKVFDGHKRSVGPLLYLPAKSKIDEDNQEIDDQRDEMFISGSSDGTAKLWNLETAKCSRTFSGHESAITCLTVEASHEVLFTGSLDCTIRSWLIETGQALKTFSGHEAPVLQIQVLNKLLFSSSSDHTAKSWVTEFGDCTRTYKGHKHSVHRFALHEGIIYTACGDHMIRAFDAKSGTLKRTFGGHLQSVNALAVLPNGRIFSISNDGSLIIWDTIGIKSDQTLRDEKKKNANDKGGPPKSGRGASPQSLNGSMNGGGSASPEVAIDMDAPGRETPGGGKPSKGKANAAFDDEDDLDDLN